MSFDLPPTLVLGEAAVRMHAAAASQQAFELPLLPLLLSLPGLILAYFCAALDAVCWGVEWIINIFMGILALAINIYVDIVILTAKYITKLLTILAEMPFPTSLFYHLYRIPDRLAEFLYYIAREFGFIIGFVLWIVLLFIYLRALDARVRLQVHIGTGGRTVAILRLGLVEDDGRPTRCLGLAVYGRRYLPDIPTLVGSEKKEETATVWGLLAWLLLGDLLRPYTPLVSVLCALLALDGLVTQVLLGSGGVVNAEVGLYVLVGWPLARLAAVLWRGEDVARSFSVRNSVLTIFHLTYVPAMEEPEEHSGK